MKKFLLGVIGFFAKYGGACAAIYYGYTLFEENGGKKALVLCIVFAICFIIGAIMKHAAKFTCWCGGEGDVIDAEYIGSSTSYDDTDSGYKKNITKKYLLTVQCRKCGKQWTTKSKKEITERHRFN